MLGRSFPSFSGNENILKDGEYIFLSMFIWNVLEKLYLKSSLEPVVWCMCEQNLFFVVNNVPAKDLEKSQTLSEKIPW